MIERLGAGVSARFEGGGRLGGLLKAIASRFEDLRASDPDGNHDLAQQNRVFPEGVQAVRHPYLLGIDRYDVVDGRLVIVTELADGTLGSVSPELRAGGIARDSAG
ncbi:MAG: hypothetical protein U0746_07000 [Gemmataceae bacterium]